MSRQLRVPAWLHDIYGERQSLSVMLALPLFGLSVASAAWIIHNETTAALPLWRSIPAFLLLLDIAAGCIANFTQATSDYYASRPVHRRIFLLVHIHLPLFALLIGTDLAYALAVWGYTIACGCGVQALAGRAVQVPAAGLCLTAGLSGIWLLPASQPLIGFTSALFLLKVVYSFGVDHYRGGRQL